ncbi:MAG: sterol desaturase family protein [Hyphomicrobiaceae bacterium]
MMDVSGWSAEGVVRLASFAAILVVMASLESVLPMRARRQSRRRRWSTNLVMAGVGVVVVRVMALVATPLAAAGAALYAEHERLGLLNLLAMPGWLELALAVVALDGFIYLQHVASHKVPLLWRLHRVHHADRDIDVTTGIRFHPVEIGLSMIYKSGIVVAFGISPVAVLVFEVLLNGTAMFNHANVRLPAWLDKAIRTILVTPDMHRVHHSVSQKEHDTNYGFALSVWDRMFGTYTAQPRLGHQGMTIGLAEHQTEAPSRLFWALALPFRANRDGGDAS